MFSMGEIIDLAIQIEKNGEKVYRTVMQRTSDPSLTSVLQWLADEELRHVEWFTGLKEPLMAAVTDPKLEEMATSMLRRILGDQTFSLNEADLGSTDKVKDLIQRAIEFERDTILFYQMISSVAQGKGTRDRLHVIIEEENRHVNQLEELLAAGVSHAHK